MPDRTPEQQAEYEKVRADLKAMGVDAEVVENADGMFETRFAFGDDAYSGEVATTKGSLAVLGDDGTTEHEPGTDPVAKAIGSSLMKGKHVWGDRSAASVEGMIEAANQLNQGTRAKDIDRGAMAALQVLDKAIAEQPDEPSKRRFTQAIVAEGLFMAEADKDIYYGPQPAGVNGRHRIWAMSDPLRIISKSLRGRYGDEEAEVILRASLERIPPEGAYEGDYAKAVRDVLDERRPGWAEED